MATAAPTTKKTVTKKVATRKSAAKAPVKKAATKAPAKKAPKAEPTAEEVAAKEAKKAEAAAAREKRAEEAQAAREARQAAKDERGAEIVRLRDIEGMAWADIAERVGLKTHSMVILAYNRATAPEPEEATPAKIKAARDTEQLSWDQIIVKFGLGNKVQAHKLYREAGGDNLTSDIGRGGRFITRDPNRKPATKAAGKKVTRAKGPIFTDETTDEDVIAKVAGKTLTWTRISAPEETDTAKVKPETTVTVKRSKANVRSIAFHDVDSKARTVRVNDIVKVGR